MAIYCHQAHSWRESNGRKSTHPVKNELFIFVPKNIKVGKKWLSIFKRDELGIFYDNKERLRH